MLRFIALAVAIAFMIGCRAPTPSFKVIAPGATRIPPPATESYRGGDSYYPGSNITAPPVGTGMRSTAPRRNQLGQSPTPALQTARQTHPDASSVEAASYETPSSSSIVASRERTSPEPRVRVVDTRSIISTARSNPAGRRINDSSGSSSFQPAGSASRVVEITQLPRATRPPSPSVGSRQTTSSSTSPPRSNSTLRGASTDKNSWRARDDVDHSARFAGR